MTATHQITPLLDEIRRLAGVDDRDPRPDRELLRLYATDRDETAFAVLVRRHGPLVWRACCRALGHAQDAEDVFQATFLVLAKKADSVRWQESVAPWLYAVAQRLAKKARADAARRPVAGDVDRAVPDPLEEMTARSLLVALDEELAGLPERCRGALLLCWLEGKTQDDAARLLGTSLSTLRRSLDRGKALLHARLSRRGLALSAALGALAITHNLATALPAGRPSARAAALAETMLTGSAKVKTMLSLLLVACLAVVGFGAAARSTPEDTTPVLAQPMPEDKPAAHVDRFGDPLPPDAIARLGSLRLNHGGTVQSFCYSADGKILASGGGHDKHVRLWDPADGKELGQLVGPATGVNVLAFAREGTRIAGGGDKVVILWDAATRQEIRRFEGHKSQVNGVAISPDGSLVAAADNDSVLLWEVATGKLRRTVAMEKADMRSVAFAPDGKSFAAAGNNEMAIWSVADGKKLHALAGAIAQSDRVLYTPDGKHVITTCWDGRLPLVWDTTTGKRVDIPPKTMRGGSVGALSRDGKLLAIATSGYRIQVWDWAESKQIMATGSHADRIRCLAFSPDGKTLASVADGGALTLRDVATGQLRHDFPGHRERLTSTVWTPDGKSVVTTAWDGKVRIWDVRTAAETRQIVIANVPKKDDYPLDPSHLGQTAVSPDARYVATPRGDEKVIVWDLNANKEVQRLSGRTAVFSPDGKLLAIGCRGLTIKDCNAGIIKLYTVPDFKEVREMRGHLTTIASLSFSADSRTLLSTGQILLGLRTGEPGESETKFIRLWDVATGKQKRVLLEGNHVSHTDLSPDGRIVASLSRFGKEVTLTETISGGPRRVLAGHSDMIFGTAFSPDGRTFATASMDGTIRLWDVFSGEVLARLHGHRSWVFTVSFSPDGTMLASGGLDTTGLVWDVKRYTQRDRKPVELPKDDLAACWKDLAGSPGVAFAAAHKLLTAPEHTSAFLAEQLRPSAAGDAKRIARLIGDLDSDEAQTRELASIELEKIGELAAPALQKTLSSRPTLETKRRIDTLLAKLDDATLSAETLRQVRAIEVLEMIRTPAARRLLEALGKGAQEARQTREARLALERIAGR